MKQLIASMVSCIICTLVFFTSKAARVDTIEVYSAAMSKNLRVAVILPSNYEKSKTMYPVLYLLHGGSGSFRDWWINTASSLLTRKAAQRAIILIARLTRAASLKHLFQRRL